MPSRQKTEQAMSPELDAIATAAANPLRAQCGDDPATVDEHAQRVADAASTAIRAGAALSAIANAERVGEQRARDELRTDILRRVERAAKRKREVDTDYDHAIDRAACLGLSHREIASAANVTHGTVRAILTRAETTTATGQPEADEHSNDQAAEQPRAEPLAA
jgi:DNA-directed RNA polymerase specialized sigma24 family protein